MGTIYRSSVILRSFSVVGVVSNWAKRDANGFSRFSYSPHIVWFCDSMNKNQNSEHAQNRDTFPFNVQVRGTGERRRWVRGCVIWGAFHLLRNSENSSWDVNGTNVFWAYHWKVRGNNWSFKKVVLFSGWKISGEKAWSIHEFSQGITGSSRLFTAISVLPAWILVTKA